MLNSVIIMGRLTADPDLRTTNSGVSFCRFSVAVDRNFQRQGQERQTDFINCVSWRQQAEFISKYFRKGQMIAIQGQLQQNNFTDQQGNKRSTYEVLVDRANFCGSKAESGAQQGDRGNSGYGYGNQQAQSVSYANSGSEDFSDIAPTEDDLPF